MVAWVSLTYLPAPSGPLNSALSDVVIFSTMTIVWKPAVARGTAQVAYVSPISLSWPWALGLTSGYHAGALRVSARGFLQVELGRLLPIVVHEFSIPSRSLDLCNYITILPWARFPFGGDSWKEDCFNVTAKRKVYSVVVEGNFLASVRHCSDLGC